MGSQLATTDTTAAKQRISVTENSPVNRSAKNVDFSRQVGRKDNIWADEYLDDRFLKLGGGGTTLCDGRAMT